MIDVLKILGILMFAKALPDMLKKMLNIDVKGNFQLNPLKKVQDNAVGGKLIAGATTGLAASAIGGVTSFRGNTVKERFSNAGKGIVEGMKGGYKNPSTLKGLNSGRVPYQEIRKKRKEEERKAQMNLAEYDRQEKIGKKLLKQSFVYDENGNHVMKTEKYVDENGNILERKSNEYKTDDSKVFSSSAYVKSFKNVEARKGEKISAENDVERKKVLYSNAVTKYGENSIEAKNALLDLEKSKKNAAAKASQFDLATKQHEEMKKIYKDDAEKEDTLSFYKKTHQNELMQEERTANEKSGSQNNMSISAYEQSSQKVRTAETNLEEAREYKEQAANALNVALSNQDLISPDPNVRQAASAKLEQARDEYSRAQQDVDAKSRELDDAKEEHKRIQELPEYQEYNRNKISADNISSSQYSSTSTVDSTSRSQHSSTSTEDSASRSQYSSTSTEDSASRSQHSSTSIEDSTSRSQHSSTNTADSTSRSQYSSTTNSEANAVRSSAEFSSKYNEFEDTIKRKERQLSEVYEEREKLKNVYGKEEEKNKLAREAQRIEIELHDAKAEKDRLMQEHPREAKKELERQVNGSMKADVQFANANVIIAENKLNSFEPEELFTDAYQRADKEYDKAVEQRKEAESNRDLAQDKIDELQRKADETINQHVKEENSNRSKIKELLEELEELKQEEAKHVARLESIRKRYGPTTANISSEGTKLRKIIDEIHARILEIQEELKKLDK